MSTSTSSSWDHDHRKRWVVYTAAGLIFLVLAGVMVALYRGAQVNQAATAKATQLHDAITQAGFTSPDPENIARVLGDDGGSVCADPASALRNAAWKLMIANGATGPGMRPVIGDALIVRGERAIITIYCPEQLPAFNALVAKLKFASVAESS